MKRNPFIPVGIALTLAVVAVVGYALRENADPAEVAASSSRASVSTQSDAAFSNHPQPSALPVNIKDPAPGEMQEVAADGSPPNVSSGSPAAGVQADSSRTADGPPGRAQTGAAEAPRNQPGAPEAGYPYAAGRSYASASVPPAPSFSVSIPLAFTPIPPAVAAANPQVADAIQGLQQDFINAVGGPNQNPNDPAYYQRWVTAQKSLDEQYHLLVGDEAFLVEQMQVNNQ